MTDAGSGNSEGRRHFRCTVAAVFAAVVLISGTGQQQQLPDELSGADRDKVSTSSLVFPVHQLIESQPKRFWNSSPSLKTREVRLKITTVLVEPYVMVASAAVDGSSKTTNQTRSSDPVRYEGFIVDLIDRICSDLGLRYQLQPTEEYGHQNADGTWNGMIRQIIDKEVDVAAAPLYITEQREEEVDFSIPFLIVQATILLKKPPTGSPSRVQSAADLLTVPDLTYGTLNTGLILRAFRTTNVSLYRTLYENIRRFHPPAFTGSNEEGIERARKGASAGGGGGGSYAFILPHTIGDYVSRRFPCDIVTVDRFLMRERFALAVPKGSGLLVQLNRAIRALAEDGFIDGIYARWLLDRSSCNGIQSSKMYSSSSHSGGVATADNRITTTTMTTSLVALFLCWAKSSG